MRAVPRTFIPIKMLYFYGVFKSITKLCHKIPRESHWYQQRVPHYQGGAGGCANTTGLRSNISLLLRGTEGGECRGGGQVMVCTAVVCGGCFHCYFWSSLLFFLTKKYHTMPPTISLSPLTTHHHPSPHSLPTISFTKTTSVTKPLLHLQLTPSHTIISHSTNTRHLENKETNDTWPRNTILTIMRAKERTTQSELNLAKISNQLIKSLG